MFASIGGFLGSLAGGPIGGAIGEWAGSGLDKYNAGPQQGPNRPGETFGSDWAIDGLVSTGARIGTSMLAERAATDAARSDARFSQGLADASYSRRIQQTVADARAAGVNPYFALASGTANQTPGPGPRVMSTTARTGAFDMLDALITGRDAEDRRERELNNDLKRVQIDTMRRNNLQASTGVARGSGKTGNGPGPDVMDATPLFNKFVNEDGDVANYATPESGSELSEIVGTAEWYRANRDYAVQLARDVGPEAAAALGVAGATLGVSYGLGSRISRASIGNPFARKTVAASPSFRTIRAVPSSTQKARPQSGAGGVYNQNGGVTPLFRDDDLIERF